MTYLPRLELATGLGIELLGTYLLATTTAPLKFAAPLNLSDVFGFPSVQAA